MRSASRRIATDRSEDHAAFACVDGVRNPPVLIVHGLDESVVRVVLHQFAGVAGVNNPHKQVVGVVVGINERLSVFFAILKGDGAVKSAV